MHIPSENDIIIPDPSFDIRDVMDFKLLSSPSPTATVQPSQPVSDRQFDSIQKFFSPSLSCLDVFYTVLHGSGGTFLSEMEERKPFRSHQRASYS